MHGGNIGIAALVSLHDCPCEWRQRHMASGERYLAALQMPLCCNVTPTWLITYHFPRPPSHFHISLSFFFFPSSTLWLTPFFLPALFPSSSHALFCSVFFSLLRDFRDTAQEPYSVGKPWGNMRRNECQVCIIQDAYGAIQYLNSAVWRIHAAIEDLWGLWMQQSICKYAECTETYKKQRNFMSWKGNVLNHRSVGCNDSVSLMQSHKTTQPPKRGWFYVYALFFYSFPIFSCIHF